MTLQVATMNIDTGENPPGTIDTVHRQAGSGTFSVQRDGSAALVTVTGRTGAGADVALTVRCPSVVGG